jgi:hypothetical protein
VQRTTGVDVALNYSPLHLLDHIKDMLFRNHPYSKSPNLRQLEWIILNPTLGSFPPKSQLDNCLPYFDSPMLPDYLGSVGNTFAVIHDVFIDGQCEVDLIFL